MAENQLIIGLKRQYSKMLGFIAAGEDQADDLAALARVIRMFSPDADLALIKPIRPYRQHRTKYLRDALGIMRRQNGPITPRALAKRILAARSMPLTPANIARAECSLHAVLERLEGRGVVREAGEPKRWRVG